MLRKVAKHMRETKQWAIICCKSKWDTTLPSSSFSHLQYFDELPPFPEINSLELVVFLDAGCANDLRNHQTTTGYLMLLCYVVALPLTNAKHSPSLQPLLPKQNSLQL